MKDEVPCSILKLSRKPSNWSALSCTHHAHLRYFKLENDTKQCKNNAILTQQILLETHHLMVRRMNKQQAKQEVC